MADRLATAEDLFAAITMIADQIQEETGYRQTPRLSQRGPDSLTGASNLGATGLRWRDPARPRGRASAPPSACADRRRRGGGEPPHEVDPCVKTASHRKQGIEMLLLQTHAALRG